MNPIRSVLLYFGVYLVAYAAGTEGSQVWQLWLGAFLLGIFAGLSNLD